MLLYSVYIYNIYVLRSRQCRVVVEIRNNRIESYFWSEKSNLCRSIIGKSNNTERSIFEIIFPSSVFRKRLRLRRLYLNYRTILSPGHRLRLTSPTVFHMVISNSIQRKPPIRNTGRTTKARYLST